MPYKISVLPSALRRLKKMDSGIRKRIVRAIDSLADYPSVSGVKPLRGTEEHYRLREGDYRIIFKVDNQEVTILVVLVGDRKDIYSRVKRLKKTIAAPKKKVERHAKKKSIQRKKD